MAKRRVPRIVVLAGTNGAGKSSVAGAYVREAGSEYFNPDEAARLFRLRKPGLTSQEANAFAWQEGVRGLKTAIAKGADYTFETTLGGSTIAELLRQAADAGHQVDVWYVALRSPELHLERIRQRVASGGHDIPEADVRRRYDASRANLVSLLPCLHQLRLSDNSAVADPKSNERPQPLLVLHYRDREILQMIKPAKAPEWAKPIIAAALRLRRR